MKMGKVFLTGATGYIGGSVAHCLLEKNYEVTGLVRNSSDASKIENHGIHAIVGSIDEVGTIRQATEQADTIINAADADNPFIVATLLEVLKGTKKTFIHTTGSSFVGSRCNGEKSDTIYHEDMIVKPAIEKIGRVSINKTVLSYAEKGVRTIVICPTMIYGQGLGIKKESIQVPLLIELAKEKGKAMHIGKGANIWSNVHITDLAHLYTLAMEKARSGSFFYAENGESSLKEVTRSISRMLGYGNQTASLSIDKAIERWGPEAAHFAFGANSRVSADKARKLLNWQPEYSSIVSDIENGSYQRIHNPK